ncbi:phosphotransferase enzyme family protein [Fusarium austroafricanum]|uniref:Phosphotransferase enzyme family protein n=1 Tax=Fusarium austroafricanum TaxID=2364996 RepID=A0A8H4K6I3_9HYPO|nr:phosphotransferase enzyme family protein [Fusarium austroafricanum]
MTAPYIRPPPAHFEEMGLFVKWGITVQISEAQSLYAIRRLLKGAVPVPEVYGWRTEGNEKYIYMEHVNGTSLEKVWPVMGRDDKHSICRELGMIHQRLRQLEQDPEDPFVGPFATVRNFHDWFTFLHRKPMPDPYSVPVEPFRHDLPDDCAIKFTHGDFHRSNIIVTPSPPYHTLAIVDWEQSGWLPEYWESRKAQYTAWRTEEWSTIYLPMIMDQFSSTWDPWDYYTTAMGC